MERRRERSDLVVEKSVHMALSVFARHRASRDQMSRKTPPALANDSRCQ